LIDDLTSDQCALATGRKSSFSSALPRPGEGDWSCCYAPINVDRHWPCPSFGFALLGYDR